MESKLTLRIFIPSILIALLLLAAYEWYFRNIEVWPAGYDENAELWSYWRAKAEHATSDDIIIIGSSRAHFNFNIHLFDSLTGKRPIMLAIPGSSPYYTFADIVNNTSFNGLLIVGVAPGLFYAPGSSYPAQLTKNDRVDFYKKQTYASKFNQIVYNYIDPNLNYLDPDLSLKKLAERLPFENRDSVMGPLLWPPMVSMDFYRSVRMHEQFENDTVLQNRQKKIWDSFGHKNRFPDSVQVSLNYYTGLVETFQSRGGKIVFVQSPVSGNYLAHEPVNYPREKYWDQLIELSGAIGYYYEDYPELKTMDPPEWSHLSRKDADTFTKKIIELLKQDKLL
jgi:hypothetical protein